MSRRGREPVTELDEKEIARRGSRVRVSETGKPYHEQRYGWSEKVKVLFDNDSIEDEVKGLNRGHALSRAASNWPTAKKIISLGGKVMKYFEGSGAIGPPDVRESTKRTKIGRRMGGAGRDF